MRRGEGDEAARALAAAVALDIRARHHRAHAVADEVAALAGREVVGDEGGELPGEFVKRRGAVVGFEARREGAAAGGFEDFPQAAHVALVAENAVDEHDGRKFGRVVGGSRRGWRGRLHARAQHERGRAGASTGIDAAGLTGKGAAV